MNSIPLLSLLIFFPLIGAPFLGFFSARQSRIALLILTILELILALFVIAAFDSSSAEFQLREQIEWIPSLNIHYQLGVDGITVLFLPLTALFFIAFALNSWNMISRPLTRLYYALILILEALTMGIFCALDTILFFTFWELTLIPIYFFVSLWGTGPLCRQAATQYTLTMLAGGVALLFGLLLAALSYSEPRFDLIQLLAEPLPIERQQWIFLLLLIGFGIKTPLFPFHSWLPTLALEGPAGLISWMTGLKLGAYGLLRVALPMNPDATRSFHWLLAGLGVIGIIYGAFVALMQTNLRRMLAFSSMSHVGLVVLALAAQNLSGIQGAVFQLLNFIVIASGLFLIAGQIHQRFGTTDFAHLGGLAGIMPGVASAFFLLGLASLGMPLTSGFPAELLLLTGVFTTYKGAGLAALVGTILATSYFFYSYRRIFWGPSIRLAGSDFLIYESWAVLFMIGVVFLFGLWPRVLLDFTQVATAAWLARFNKF